MKTWKAEEVLAMADNPALLERERECLRELARRLKLDESAANPSLEWKWCPKCGGHWQSSAPVCEHCDFDCRMPAQAAQDGDVWVLVPREPTPEMLKAAQESNLGRGQVPRFEPLRRRWNAMLAAAPDPAAG